MSISTRSSKRFVADKGFQGTEGGAAGGSSRAGPVQFEKEADDPFGLDEFLDTAKKASKRKDDDGDRRREDRSVVPKLGHVTGAVSGGETTGRGGRITTERGTRRPGFGWCPTWTTLQLQFPTVSLINIRCVGQVRLCGISLLSGTLFLTGWLFSRDGRGG